MATSVGSGSYRVQDGDTSTGRSWYDVNWSAQKTDDNKLKFTISLTGVATSTAGGYVHYVEDVELIIGSTTYVLCDNDRYDTGDWNNDNSLGGNSTHLTKTYTKTVPLLKSGTTVKIYTLTMINQLGQGENIKGRTQNITSSLGTGAYEVTEFQLTLNAGTGITSTSGGGKYKQGVTVSIDAIVSNGYTWNKWTGSTSYLNSSTTTKSNSVTMPSSNITLTANATANTYKVNWDAQGGSASSTSSNIQFNSTYTLPTATKEGYTLKGWYTATSGGTQITTSTKHTTVGDVTYYAQWTPITYTIVFNANGGSGTMSNMSCTYDQSYNLTKNIFTKEKYIFTGWATSVDGEIVYQDQESIKNLTEAKNIITLYAVWIEEGITYIYYNNKYQKAQVYIFDDGFWKLTQPCCYDNGWKVCSG